MDQFDVMSLTECGDAVWIHLPTRRQIGRIAEEALMPSGSAHPEKPRGLLRDSLESMHHPTWDEDVISRHGLPSFLSTKNLKLTFKHEESLIGIPMKMRRCPGPWRTTRMIGGHGPLGLGTSGEDGHLHTEDVMSRQVRPRGNEASSRIHTS